MIVDSSDPTGRNRISLDELRKTNRNVFFEEGWRLWGIHTEPKFGIGQRALLLQRQGGFLWDCVSLIDASTVGLVKALGGLSAIAVSHPHYYSSMVEWSRAFGGIPIYLHEADREWVQHPDPAIVFWKGETHQLSDDLTLIRVGGHSAAFRCFTGLPANMATVRCSAVTCPKSVRIADMSASCTATPTIFP